MGKGTQPDHSEEIAAIKRLRSENAAAESDVRRLAEEMQRVAMQTQLLARERDSVSSSAT